ncbi:MAG: ribonucleotide reductase, partial [Gammaproteobacteria bacterium]
MLNWDDPLAPPVLQMPESNLEASVTSAESTKMPVGLDLRQDRSVKHAPGKIQRPVINPVVAKPINADDKRVVIGLTDIN